MNIVNYITHEITIWTAVILIAIASLFKIIKYFIKEYYNAKRFLKKYKMTEKEMKQASRKASIDNNKKIDNLTKAFSMYVEANGVKKEVKDKVKKILEENK